MLNTWLLLALGLLGICVAACVCLRLLLVEVTVEGQSMQPALEPGERVLVLRYWPARRLRKGQIVVASFVSQNRRARAGAGYVIKRITGLPEQQIIAPVRDGARPFLDGAAQPAHKTWHIPPGHIFIQSDNPPAGTDSTSYGPIPIKQVFGVVIRTLPGKSNIALPASAGRAKLRIDGLAAGQPAPSFSAETLSGETVTLERYAGRAVALLFTIPSQICVELLPDYEALRPYARAAGVELVLVWNDDMEQARRFVERLKPTLPILVACEQDNPLTRDYDIQLWPSYCLIDAEGIVRSCGHPNEPAGEWTALAESWRAVEAQMPAPAAVVGGASHG